MLPIKSSDDIESLQELTYLFSDTLTYALGKGLISKEDVDGCQPNVMIALPRLSLVRGLLQGYGSVVCKLNVEELSSILRPYHRFAPLSLFTLIILTFFVLFSLLTVYYLNFMNS